MRTRQIFVWTKVAGLFLLGVHGPAFAGTNEITTALSKALFEEEANHNLDAAVRYYQSAIEHFDADRKLAATAVFRLGECYRKQGSTNQATGQYQRVLHEFADQTQLVTLSRQYLVALGGPNSAEGEAGQSNLPNGVSERLANVIDLGEIKRVQTIINSSPDLINAPDQSGRTLLQTYAGKGDVEVIKLLLSSGAAVNGIKQPDLTPLHFAAGNGHKAAVELLLSKGAKVDPVTGSGVTPLHLAVLKGYELVAKVLLDSGANVKAALTRDADSGSADLSYTIKAYQTPLHLACTAGYGGLVDLLISKGADVNAQDGKGWTPLTVAVDANNEDMVKALLAAHADPNAGRSSALNLAAGRGSVPLLDLLVTHGAKLDLTSALLEAVEKNHPAAVSKLIQLKADPNARFASGEPLALGALNSPELLRALLDGGANPDDRTLQGETLLGRAAANDSPVTELLLEHGADPNKQNTETDWSALHYAAAYSRLAPTEALLKHNANVNTQSKNGETPLLFAVRSRNQEITALLLSHGADPNLQDHNGETPLDSVRKSLGNPPSGIPGLPGGLRTPLQQDSAKLGSIQELLLQHGASTDLPRMDRIEVRRFPNQSYTVFSRSTNDINRFSLLELLAAHYGFISESPRQGAVQASMYSRTSGGSLSFPNLKKIEIRHAKPGGTNWTTTEVSAEAILETADCSGDVWLNWGDQVEISEADHPVSSQWRGFSPALLTNLFQCVKRTASVTVKAQTSSLSLEAVEPGNGNASYQPPQFFLLPALRRSNLLRISSDLSRVKVTRHSAATVENWEKTFDCTGTAPGASLWLRDGDQIEVPDKP